MVGHRGRGDRSWEKGSETSPHAGASRVHLWEEACARGGDSLWVWGALQISNWGGPKRDWQGPEQRGPGCPLRSLDFTAGEQHIQTCLQKKPLCCHCSE